MALAAAVYPLTLAMRAIPVGTAYAGVHGIGADWGDHDVIRMLAGTAAR